MIFIYKLIPRQTAFMASYPRYSHQLKGEPSVIWELLNQQIHCDSAEDENAFIILILHHNHIVINSEIQMKAWATPRSAQNAQTYPK